MCQVTPTKGVLWHIRGCTLRALWCLMRNMTHLHLLGSRDAAKMLGITRQSLNRKVLNGDLKPAGKVGPRGINVFSRSEIEALAQGAKR